MTKGQAMALRINVLRYNGFAFRKQSTFCEKNWTPKPSASGSYDRVADRVVDKTQLDFEIFKILYRLNYLDFYFVNMYQCNVIISVRSAFNLVGFFSQTKHT